MTFVATVYREFFSEPNSSPHEVSGGFISIFPSASMHTGRLSACRESFVVCIVGKMAQDVGMV